MARLPVIGGPADGARVAAAPRTFRWIDPQRETGFSSPAPGRALYRCEDGRWVYAGMRSWECPGCGGVVTKPDDARLICFLCGAEKPREEAVHG